MKKNSTILFKKTIGLIIVLLCACSVSVNAQCRLLNETFDVTPVLSPTNVDGTWYPDRYPPAGFASAVLAGNNVLKISIDGTNDGAAARPPGLQGSFYNTQGRKFNQCGSCVTVAKGDLWIPNDWATKHRRSDMWATAFDNTNTVSAYPIIGFRNVDGVSPGIYCYNISNNTWINSGVVIAYDLWYSLQFRLVGTNLEYLVNNVVVVTLPALGSTYFGDIIMQAYNFNDPALLPINQSTDSYDAYWDNLVTTGTGGKVVTNTNTGQTFCSIQSAINDPLTLNGHTITASAGNYNEDVVINKQLTLIGAGYATTTVSGPIGGGGSTMQVAASGVIIEGFTITRDGNNTTDWNNPGLNSAGVSIQGAFTGTIIRKNKFTGMRTAIDINNSNGHSILDNIITFNRTGLIFRNQTDNMTVTGNEITDNWTVGVLFLDASGGTNVPVQSALNGAFNNNNISGNWYGEIVDRQSGGALPAPGTTNLKQFTCNWYGTVTPVLTTANSAEPGYAGQIPVAYGGTATNPGGAPDIAGSASANIVYITYLVNGTDNDPAMGFQPVPNSCSGCPSGNTIKNTNTGEFFCSIQAAIDDAQTANGHTITVSSGTYSESVTINKSLTLSGANASVSPCSGPRTSESTIMGSFTIAANGITIKGFEFTGAGAQIASTAGLSTWSSIDIQNNWLHATTAQIPIRHGLGLGGGIGTTNWTVSNNKIEDIQLNDATAIALFNINNVVANNNCITHANGGFIGRRGINADGLQNATLNGNSIDLGDINPTAQTNAIWGIQVSMSDRDATGITIDGNIVSNVYRAVVVLSQRNLTGLTVQNNEFGPVVGGVDCNTGGTVPQIAQPVQSNISIKNNKVTTVTTTIPGAFGAAVRLRNLHSATANGPVTFNNVQINENSFIVTAAAIIYEAGTGIINENATCNWYGTANHGVIATKISGPVTYIPYLTNGADNAAATGFQPFPGSCNGVPRPALTTTVNGATVVDNNDATPDVAAFGVCNTPAPNLFFSGFTDLNNIGPVGNVRVRQEFTHTNTTWVGPNPVDGDHPLSAYAGAFSRQIGLVNPGATGTLTMSFQVYYDANSDNVLDGGDYAGDKIIYTVTVTPQVKLNTSINGTVVNSNNDGADDNASFSVCNKPNNILFNYFADANGITGPLLKSFQVIQTTNVTVPFCNNCSAALTAFAGATGTASLINPLMPGTLVMKFKGFYDTDMNGQVGANECGGDWVIYTVTINPNVLTINCPANITINCQDDSFPENTGNATGSGSCDNNVIISYDDQTVAGGCPNSYTINRTWTITDALGNTNSCVQVITVQDVTAPVLASAPAAVTVECIGDVPAMTNLTWTDNCDGTGSVAGVDGPLTGGNCGGTIARTWNFTDACGNVAVTRTQVITVDDNTIPVLASAPAAVTVECIGDVPAMTNLAWTDNCDGTGSVAGVDGPLTGGNCGGTITRTWNFTDACGNIAVTRTQTITVDDNTIPVLATAPAAVSVQCVGNIPAMTSLTWTDNCSAGGSVAGVDGPLTGGACGGTITRTWNVSDACGNPAITRTQVITVADKQAPVLTVPADASVECNAIPPFITASASATDNCGGSPSITLFSNIGTPQPIGMAYTGARVNGNQNYGDRLGLHFRVNSPVAVNQLGAYDDGQNGLNLPITVGIVRESDGSTVVPPIVMSGTSDPLDGQYRVRFVPTIVLTPGEYIVVAVGYGNGELNGNSNNGGPAATFNDGGGVLTSLSSPYGGAGFGKPTTPFPTPSIFHAGTFKYWSTLAPTCPVISYQTRTWRAIDVCGNATIKSQTLTITDNTAPILTVPADVTLQCSDPLPIKPININSSPNGLNGTYNFGTAVFGPALTSTPVTGDAVLVNDAVGNGADACEPITNILTGNIAVIDRGGCAAPDGLFTSKVLKAQNAGAIAVIIVNNVPGDNVQTMGGTDPMVTIPSVFVSNNFGNALKASLNLGTVNVSLSASPLTLSDCSATVITHTQTITPGNCAGNYSILNSWTATDACGNATTETQTITVQDNTPPVIAAAPGPITVECVTDVPGPTQLAWTDNCDAGGMVTSSDGPVVGGICGGTITRTWNVMDACGNPAITRTQIITVDDNTAPVLTVPADVTLQCSDPLPIKPININSSPNGLNGTYNFGTAVFGPALTSTPVTGDAVLANDAVGNTADACQLITNILTGNIAVIDRGGCAAPDGLFTSKVLKAQNAGAIAVIIVNNVPGDNVLTMGLQGPDPGIIIPSIFVSSNYGNALKASMAMGTVNVSLSASPLSVSDCSATVITHSQTITPGNCAGNYSILNSWTATDGCGNATTETQTITVEDNTTPVISTSAVSGDLGCNPVVVAPVFTGLDVCEGIFAPVVTTTGPSSTAGCNWTQTWNANYTDPCGNAAAQVSISYTWKTATGVILQAPDNQLEAACQTQAQIQTAYNNWLTEVVYSGGCNLVVTNDAPVNAPSACGGSVTVTWTAASSCETNASRSATFTVSNAPGVILQAPADQIEAACQTQLQIQSAYNNWLNGVVYSGGCNLIVTNNAPVNAPSACGGSVTVMWTAASSCEPNASRSATFTVLNAPGVTLQAPADQIEAACQTQLQIQSAYNNWLNGVVYSGGCNLVVTNNAPVNAPSACGGSVTVTWTAASSCETNASRSATFTVNNAPGVTLQAPAANNQPACQTQAQIQSAYNTWLAGVFYSGGCGLVVTNDAPVNAPSACGGSVTVTWTATSNCEITYQRFSTFSVTADNIAPTVTTGSISSCYPTVSAAEAAALAATSATDNCPGALTEVASTVGTCSAVITVTTTDGCGNATSVTYSTRIDNTAPVIACPSNQSKATNPGQCYYAAVGNEFNPSASDNCAGAVTVENDFNNSNTLAGAQFPIGTTTVVWTATDACGNTATCNFDVTVTDDQNATDYIIYAEKEAKFGEYNFIGGDVGVTASNGKAEFKKYDVLDPNTVRAKNISVQSPSTVNNRVYSPATGGPTPTFYPYNGNTTGLSNIDVTVNGTILLNNHKDVKVKKGITATISGNNYGKITIEEGANVTFTAGVINIKELRVEKGKKNDNVLTIVSFTNPSSVKVKDKVTIEDDCRVNEGGPKVTFYTGDNTGGDEKFEVKGENSRVTANIMIPEGKLKVDGGTVTRPTIMTGWYIIEKLDGHGKYVYWNRYDCAPVIPFAPTTITSKEEPIVEPVVTVAEKPVQFEVRAYPNPSAVSFSIVVKSQSMEPIVVKVMDMSGKVLSVISNVTKGSVINLGNELRGGTYIAEVTQGKNRQTIKLVKLN